MIRRLEVVSTCRLGFLSGAEEHEASHDDRRYMRRRKVVTLVARMSCRGGGQVVARRLLCRNVDFACCVDDLRAAGNNF